MLEHQQQRSGTQEPARDQIAYCKAGIFHQHLLPANIDRSAYLNAFSNFERKHPGLRVEVLIDAGEEGLLNGAADVAYFGYRAAKEGITWIPAGHNVTFLMASRGYLRGHGSPQSVEELRNHTLQLRNTSNRSFSRRLENRDAVFEIESDDKVYFEDAYSCRTHLIAGEGISVRFSVFFCR